MGKREDKIKEIELCQRHGDTKAEWFIDAVAVINELGGLQLKEAWDDGPIPAQAPVEHYCAKNGICYGILPIIRGWAKTKPLNELGWKYLKQKLDNERYQKAIEMKNITEEEIEIKTTELIGGQYK